MRKRIIIAAALAILLVPSTVSAVQPDEVLSNPVLEQRARSISSNLKCLVCQNQSIDDSEAPLARDLRLIVRERLQAGDSDTEIYDFVVARYGEFVLLNPVFAGHTVVLWAATPLLLVTSLFALTVLAARRRNIRTGASSLSIEEVEALERLNK